MTSVNNSDYTLSGRGEVQVPSHLKDNILSEVALIQMLRTLNKTLSGRDLTIYKTPRHDHGSTELNDVTFDATRNICSYFLKGRMTLTKKCLTFIIYAYYSPDF